MCSRSKKDGLIAASTTAAMANASNIFQQGEGGAPAVVRCILRARFHHCTMFMAAKAAGRHWLRKHSPSAQMHGIVSCFLRAKSHIHRQLMNVFWLTTTLVDAFGIVHASARL